MNRVDYKIFELKYANRNKTRKLVLAVFISTNLVLTYRQIQNK